MSILWGFFFNQKNTKSKEIELYHQVENFNFSDTTGIFRLLQVTSLWKIIHFLNLSRILIDIVHLLGVVFSVIFMYLRCILLVTFLPKM